jgi:hypothetical protein
MHIGTVALLGACAISGTLRVDVRRLMRYLAITTVLTVSGSLDACHARPRVI